jgi:hypothetical protein
MEPVAEEILWADTLAARLKLLQASCADDAAETRQAFIFEQIERSLQPVGPSKKRAHLEALASRFPTWDTNPMGPSAAPAPAAETDSPEIAFSRFLKTIPSLKPDQKLQFQARLRAAGWTDAPVGALPDDVHGDLLQKLKLGPAQTIDVTRLGRLSAALIELFITVDQLVWSIWKNLAPKSSLRRDASLGDTRTALARYLAGEPEITAAQITQQLDRSRQLMAGILAAIGPSGRNYARRHMARYSAEAIRDAVKAESGGSLFSSAEARCWKKYGELAGELNEDAIEAEIQEAIVKYAEELMTGSKR